MYSNKLNISSSVAKIKGLAFVTALMSLIVSISIAAMPLASSASLSIGGPSDCDNNAIIHCGAHSVGEIVRQYNDHAYIRAVYSSYGINRADINNLSDTAVAGTVTKSGDVFVGNRLVARHAVTGGRQDIEPGSTRVNVNGAIFFKRPPSVSFLSSSLPAFVSMSDGQFQFAVIASCGNAVSAEAVKQPKVGIAPARPVSKPTAQAPAPTQTQTQTQIVNQQIIEEESQPQPIVNGPTQLTPTTTTPAITNAPAAAVLPNTGPGEVAGFFLASSIAGFLGYRRFLVRKLGY